MLLESLFNDPSVRKTNFVMVHAGAGNYDTLVPYLLMKTNVYAEFSEQTWIIAPHHMSQAIRYMLESYPEKVMFGTDLFPGTPQIDWEEIGYQTVEGGRSALAFGADWHAPRRRDHPSAGDLDRPHGFERQRK